MEQTLSGGRTTPGVVLVEGTVRRPHGRHSDFVAGVLGALGAVNVSWAPRHFGVDGQGRDVLTFIPGRTTDHPSQRSARAYARFGQMLRELHAVTSGTALADEMECVMHGDPGPYNVITQAGMPVGLIDWDSARPGDPLEDLGYAGWTWCIRSTGNVPVTEQAQHLRELRDGYDPTVPAMDLLAAVAQAQHHVAEAEQRNADNDELPEWRRDHARVAIAWAHADAELLRTHQHTIAARLREGEAPATGRPDSMW